MKNKNIKLYEIYFGLIQKPMFLDIIIYNLYKLNDTFIFKNKLYTLIYKLEQKKYKNCNHSNKLIDTKNCDFLIETVNGYNKCKKIHRTIPYDVYKLKLEDDKFLLCADNHYVYADINHGEQKWVFVCNLKKGDYVYTSDKWKKVISVKKQKYKMYMADISVESIK